MKLRFKIEYKAVIIDWAAKGKDGYDPEENLNGLVREGWRFISSIDEGRDVTIFAAIYMRNIEEAE